MASGSPRYAAPVHGLLTLPPGPARRYTGEEAAARVFGDPQLNALKAMVGALVRVPHGPLFIGFDMARGRDVSVPPGGEA